MLTSFLLRGEYNTSQIMSTEILEDIRIPILDFVKAVQEIKLDQTPDYEYLKTILGNTLKELGLDNSDFTI